MGGRLPRLGDRHPRHPDHHHEGFADTQNYSRRRDSGSTRVDVDGTEAPDNLGHEIGRGASHRNQFQSIDSYDGCGPSGNRFGPSSTTVNATGDGEEWILIDPRRRPNGSWAINIGAGGHLGIAGAEEDLCGTTTRPWGPFGSVNFVVS